MGMRLTLRTPPLLTKQLPRYSSLWLFPPLPLAQLAETTAPLFDQPLQVSKALSRIVTGPVPWGAGAALAKVARARVETRLRNCMVKGMVSFEGEKPLVWSMSSRRRC
jgi:hypothetical protein